MKKLLQSITLAALVAAASAHAATPASEVPTSPKHVAQFCGADGHEDGSPGYGEWLKANLDNARARGIGDAVALALMRTTLCDFPSK